MATITSTGNLSWKPFGSQGAGLVGLALPWGSEEGEVPGGRGAVAHSGVFSGTQPHPIGFQERRDDATLKIGRGVTEESCPECPGLGVVTHWPSEADHCQAPGWRLYAASRCQERHSPVCHSPSQRGRRVRHSQGLGEPLGPLGCLRPGYSHIAYPDLQVKRAGYNTISFALMVSTPTRPLGHPSLSKHPTRGSKGRVWVPPGLCLAGRGWKRWQGCRTVVGSPGWSQESLGYQCK